MEKTMAKKITDNNIRAVLNARAYNKSIGKKPSAAKISNAVGMATSSYYTIVNGANGRLEPGDSHPTRSLWLRSYNIASRLIASDLPHHNIAVVANEAATTGNSALASMSFSPSEQGNEGEQPSDDGGIGTVLRLIAEKKQEVADEIRKATLMLEGLVEAETVLNKLEKGL